MATKLFTATKKVTAAGVALTVLLMTSGAGRAAAQAATASSGAKRTKHGGKQVLLQH